MVNAIRSCIKLLQNSITRFRGEKSTYCHEFLHVRIVWISTTSDHIETGMDCKHIKSTWKPRFVILGFQINRKDRIAANANCFDHCNLTNVKLFLNSQSYPYSNLNLDVNRNKFVMLYDMYANFPNSYYGMWQCAFSPARNCLTRPEGSNLLTPCFN